MIPSLRTCVRLPYSTTYDECGAERQIVSGTPIDWVTVTRITGAIDLVPGDSYESDQGSPVQYCIWAGAATRNLAHGETIDVAVLQASTTALILPLDELCGTGTNEWDVRIAILAWEQVRHSQSYELHRPLVINGTDPGYVPYTGGSNPTGS